MKERGIFCSQSPRFDPQFPVPFPSVASLEFPKLLTNKEIFGAGDGNRTHDIQLGKLTFYL
jgi:hypothetical protein